MGRGFDNGHTDDPAERDIIDALAAMARGRGMSTPPEQAGGSAARLGPILSTACALVDLPWGPDRAAQARSRAAFLADAARFARDAQTPRGPPDPAGPSPPRRSFPLETTSPCGILRADSTRVT